MCAFVWGGGGVWWGDVWGGGRCGVGEMGGGGYQLK